MTAAPPPLVFSFDLTGTLADIDGVSHRERICRISPLEPEQVRRVLHDTMRLKTLSTPSDLTDDLIAEICTELRIDPADFPYGTQPPAPYRLRPGARDAVATAAHYLPTVVIGNVSVFASPGVRPVSAALAPHVTAVYSSWAMGWAKPDPRAFATVAHCHRATVADLIHISASWQRDVAPVLALGGRAVWLNHHQTQVPGSETVPRGRLLVANNLHDAVDHAVARWLRGPTT